MTQAATRTRRGFSLVELMVTIAVLAVTLALAIPSFANLTAQNRLAAASNGVQAALMAARQTAISLGRPVSLCAGDPATGCNGDWPAGQWLVYEDSDGDGRLDDTETLLRQGTVPGPDGAVVIEGNGPFDEAIVYLPEGRAVKPGGGFAAGTLRVCVRRAIGENAVEVVIAASGRVRKTPVDLDGQCPPL
ncbi:MAG: GspH/FimT family pseudopilin [Halothiobacillaceae bacterium]|nr:GspH/FimT family pseudopilin [Halothiobacillaceae bacterium]